MTRRTLVAGCGNIFLGDDGFGVEVARRLATRPLPEHVKVTDFGIRGVHLAFELLDGYDTAILVDATPRGEPPGTITVLEPEMHGAAELIDAHGLPPHQVLDLLSSLGSTVERFLVVGCEPAEVSEHIGLSPTVDAAVDEAVRVIVELVTDTTSGHAEHEKGVDPCSES